MTDLWVPGSLAADDYVSEGSDLDLIVLVGGRVDQSPQLTSRSLHHELDGETASGPDLDCQYVEKGLMPTGRSCALPRCPAVTSSVL